MFLLGLLLQQCVLQTNKTMIDVNCSDCTNKKNKTTIDGKKVCSYCKKWMEECEARSLMQMDLAKRRFYLSLVEDQRGEKSANILKNLLLTIWQKNRPPVGRRPKATKN